jgi:methionyl-tRNA formyltransferase
MRIAFLGTPEFAVPALDVLAARHTIAAVYCQPPRPAGRGKALLASPVQRRAEALGLPVRTPASLKDATEQAAFAALALDSAIVAAYGLILPPPILAAPRHGCLNIHASLLPRWRGAAPIQRAILAGDEVSGVTLMQMDEGLDTGPMLHRLTLDIRGKNAGQVTQELAKLGAQALLDWLDEPTLPEPQPIAGATYAAKIDKAEARIDWAREPAEHVALVLDGDREAAA